MFVLGTKRAIVLDHVLYIFVVFLFLRKNERKMELRREFGGIFQLNRKK